MIDIGKYFQGFAVKVLADVDVNKLVSNQHEFNGSKAFRELLGTPIGRQRFATRMAYLDDNSSEMPELFSSTLTWYDARENVSNRSPEYRLLYKTEAEHVIYKAAAGDVLFLAQEKSGSLILVIAQQGSTILRQLQWIFSVPTVKNGTFITTDMENQPPREEMASEGLLTLLGIEVDLSDDRMLDVLLERFPTLEWPSTEEFSNFARTIASDCDPVQDPDAALMLWVTTEHRLFRTLERFRISKSIESGFIDMKGEVDVDAFLKLSLSVQNRRKSRAGLSFEEHINFILLANGVMYEKKAKTEGRKEPDFLFPSKACYDDESFPSDQLAMLGAKTTLKDRWRQVLNEADRIKIKHLITLQPAISEHQTNEMKAENLQLVIPSDLHVQGFTLDQQRWLMKFADFIKVIKDRERGFL